MFVMVAANDTMNVSATLFVAEYQLNNIETELKLKNVVIPPADPVTEIV